MGPSPLSIALVDYHYSFFIIRLVLLLITQAKIHTNYTGDRGLAGGAELGYRHFLTGYSAREMRF